VPRLRKHFLVAKHIQIYGYIYDVHSGRLVEVAAATNNVFPVTLAARPLNVERRYLCSNASWCLAQPKSRRAAAAI
jgi:hypothetical protein